MAERLAYEDTDKRIYVIDPDTDDGQQQVRVEWVNPAATGARLDAVAALADKANATAQEVAKAARPSR